MCVAPLQLAERFATRGLPTLSFEGLVEHTSASTAGGAGGNSSAAGVAAGRRARLPAGLDKTVRPERATTVVSSYDLALDRPKGPLLGSQNAAGMADLMKRRKNQVRKSLSSSLHAPTNLKS